MEGAKNRHFCRTYWTDGNPMLLASNVACAEYSDAKLPGKNVAYRWNEEQIMSKGVLVYIDRDEIF